VCLYTASTPALFTIRRLCFEALSIESDGPQQAESSSILSATMKRLKLDECLLMPLTTEPVEVSK
jgi:hypothetical protein